jgi:Tfp pilus assembly protein PilX/cytoskeletal protein CcmA (bactofilin family)
LVRPNNEQGSSLVLALTVAVLLFALATVVAHVTGTELRSAAKQKEQTCAYYTAEAGIDRAILEINERSAGSSWSLNEPYHQGDFSVLVSEERNAEGDTTGYTIVSEGRCGHETKTLTAHAARPTWSGPGSVEMPKALTYAMYAEKDISVRTLSGLLGIGPIATHAIRVDGNAHANGTLLLKHYSLGATNPKVNGVLSSTNLGNILVQGLKTEQKKVEDRIAIAKFDFDAAREYAKNNGLYIPHGMAGLSLLGLTLNDFIFIDGDLVSLDVDLLGLDLMNKTIVVNGKVLGALERGGDLLKTNLNIIAKDDIYFAGLITGIIVNGILYSEGDIKIAGHAEVHGYIGAENIKIGAGLLSNLTSILSGNMVFEYNPDVFDTLPPDIGFLQEEIIVVGQGE